ncbi:hypothetical protein [Marinoscillum sp.]|uniref:hypothetical protein n=1 Tax=Marinoscillum sp. TaxID=2024838 RepID=UPI003BAC6888
MQRTYLLGIHKHTKAATIFMAALHPLMGLFWIWGAIVEGDSLMKWLLGSGMTLLGIYYLVSFFLGFRNNRMAPKLMLDDEEIIFKPRMNNQLVRLQWDDLSYLNVVTDQLYIQLKKSEQNINYRTVGIFSKEAISDLKETAESKDIQFGEKKNWVKITS